MISRFYLIVFFLFTHLFVIAQTNNDVDVLSPEKIMQLIARNNPVVLQSSNKIQQAAAAYLVAKGSFDPILSYNAGSKTLGGSNYYNYNSPHLEVPTWYGIEFLAGAEFWNGNNVNPANSIGQTSFAGISVPLLKDLILDKRRATLAKAKVYNTLSAIEQQALINQINYEALDIYWQWNKAYQKNILITKILDANIQRLEFVKKAFINGERAAIDTIETLAQLQVISNKQNENWLMFQNLGFLLTSYLWQDNLAPYVYTDSLRPAISTIYLNQFADSMAINNAIAQALDTHPEIQLYKQKYNILSIDKKLQFQTMLPKLDLKYNALSKNTNPLANIADAQGMQNNFQYGVKFEMPLRISEGRGQYKIASLRLIENKLAMVQKQNDIKLKINAIWNNNNMLLQQYKIIKSYYNNYQTLSAAENTKFQNGESSLFLINIREIGVLDAFDKLIDVENKIQKNKFALQFAMGSLR
jgi:outer membrane protein TolC